MNDYCMIETAFSSMEELNLVVEKLLDEKLVASCQVVESNSYWNWNNTRENAHEYILIMKTKKNFTSSIYNIIKDIHSYECFEFAIFELSSINVDYLKWIDKETSK